MARPNITGITGLNEILLGGTTTDGKARVKLDLVNKTKTELTADDPAYDFPLSRADWPQVFYNDKLYYWVGTDNYLREYDMTAGVHTTLTTIQSNYKQTLFVKNGYLYISASSSRLYAYDLTTLSQTSAAYIYMSDMKLPTDFVDGSNYSYNYAFANYSDTEDILITVYDANNIDQRAIVVQDLTTESIINLLPRVYSAVNYSVNNEVILFDYYIREDEIYRNLQGLTAITYANFGEHGVKMSKYSGNMLSFKVYDTPQTIASDEVARVEYCYKYGE